MDTRVSEGVVTARPTDATNSLAYNSLAIVIPSKNRENDILRCLASINEQPTQPDQIIVIDQSQEPYRLDRFPNVLHIHNPSLSGLTAAKNYALQFVTSESALFLDDDVELLNDCVAPLKREFLNHPDAAAIGCSITEAPQSIRERISQVVFRRGFFNRAPIKRPEGVELRTLSGGATAIRKSILMREPFDETLRGVGFGEDFEFSVRAKSHGRFWLCRSARLLHHFSPSNRLEAQKARRELWDHYLYFYDKLGAGRQGWNRLWLLMWMIGESFAWIRLRMGLPPILSAMRQRMTAKRTHNRR